MTWEKLIILFFSLLLFIICISIFVKTAEGKKRRAPTAILGSMGLGALALTAVWLLEFVCGKLISINLCTILISLLGSLPAVAAMLFLNVI